MSDCLHCEINQLVQERFERGDTDLVEMASMMVESLADLILLAPESDRSNLMAHALSAFGQIVWKRVGRSMAVPTPPIEVRTPSTNPVQPGPASRNSECLLLSGPTRGLLEHSDAYPGCEGRPKLFAAFQIV
jgi:hypothetical protein